MKKSLVVITLFILVSKASYADKQHVENALKDENVPLAEQAFKALTTNEQQSVDGQVLAGRLLLVKGDTEDAFEYFEALQEVHSNNVDVNYYLGVSAVIMAQKASIFSKLSYAKSFIKAMEQTVALKPDHQDALNTLIGFHLNAPGIAGADTELAMLYAKQLQKVNAEKGYSQIANVYWQTDRAELADKTMQEAIDKFPQSSVLYYSRALVQMKKEQWQAAHNDLALAINYAQNDELKTRALYQQGKVSVKSGENIEQGIAALTNAIPISDKQYKPWVQYRLVQLYVQQKKLVKANEFLIKIDVSDDEELEDKVKKLKNKLKKLMS